MAGRYEIVFPAKGRQLLDGGLNSKFERSIIADNESPDCLNVVFSYGSVGTRGGSTLLNTTAVGSNVCDGIYTRRDTATNQTMVAFFGGTAWQLGSTTFTTIPSAQSVFTAGNRVGAALYQNYMFMGNGGVAPYKYDGTYFTRHGVPEASGTISVACGGAGNIAAGTYSYRVTYVNSAAVEGDVGTAATVTLSASGTVSVTGIPTAPQSHGVAQRYIYRTAVGGTVYKRLATINDNTTTSYSDNAADSSLGVDAPDDQGEPPNYQVICYHQNRLFVNDATNRNYLWYSELGEPFTFKADSFIQVADEAADLLQSIDVHQNNIVLGCDNSDWLVYMPSTDPSDWSLIRITSAFGTRSPYGGFRFNDKFMFPAMQNDKFVGMAAIVGSSIDPTATSLDIMVSGSELKSDAIETDMFDVQEAYVKNISSMVFKNKAYISVTHSAGNTRNNRIYLFDFSISNLSKGKGYAWSRYSGVNAAQFTVYNGRLYYGSSLADGKVFQLETDTYQDNGSAINSYFWTKEFAGIAGHESYIKDFRKLKIFVDLAGDYRMTVNWRVDSDSLTSGGTNNIDLDPGTMTWNSGVWGTDVWGTGKGQQEIEISLGQTFGRRIQFQFTNQNTAGQRFKVHGISFSYNIRGTT